MPDISKIQFPVRYTTFFLALGGLVFSLLLLLALSSSSCTHESTLVLLLNINGP